ncbi:MAG: HAMP domain-containing histidine kinase [Oscillospiraceae bacterium]|nr:HAMP domain-containing histidine kinase [Oscillospiraceae bacterium]
MGGIISCKNLSENGKRNHRPLKLKGEARLFLITAVCIALTFLMGIFFGKLSAEKAAEGYISNMLGRFGAVCDIIPEEYSENAALAFAGRHDSEDISKGQEILKKYGYSLDMPHEYTVNFGTLRIRSEWTWAAFGAAAFIIGALVFGVHARINGRKIISVCREAEKLITAPGGSYSEKGLLTGVPRYVSGTMARISRYADHLQSSLEKEENYVGGLISDISHQMKTPVAALMINCEIMQREPEMETERRLDFLDRCLIQLDRLDWLIAGLLKSARLDSGAIEFDMKPHELREAVSEAVELNRRAAEEKGIEIDDRTPEGMLLQMDIRWLCEAFGNIIKNSVEHTAEGGRIEIDGSETPLTARVRISDNGAGIPPELMPRIFERFCSHSPKGNHSSKGTCAKSSAKNVGLGLSISRSIIHRHNGHIRAESKQGKGTVFEVTFVREKREC